MGSMIHDNFNRNCSRIRRTLPEQKYTLYRNIERQLVRFVGKSIKRWRQSVLDVLPVDLGPILRPLTSGDDLLGEMLETRE